MARTLNAAVHTVRREAFVDAAQRLMQAKGYEQMSVQDVLDELDASRGAFYHYFDSKQALLEAVVDRIVDAAMLVVYPVVADPGLPATAKLERVFSTIGRWKTERKALMLALMQVWMSDDNAIVREKIRRLSVTRLTPVLTPIIEQGVREGTFVTESPAETTRVLIVLLLGFQEVAIELFIGRQAGSVRFEVVERTFKSYTESFERILGVPRGSINLLDEVTLHEWFG
jgi:AcrR family transcriptional regulator